MIGGGCVVFGGTLFVGLNGTPTGKPQWGGGGGLPDVCPEAWSMRGSPCEWHFHFFGFFVSGVNPSTIKLGTNA